jgi:hypothetical protein
MAASAGTEQQEDHPDRCEHEADDLERVGDDPAHRDRRPGDVHIEAGNLRFPPLLDPLHVVEDRHVDFTAAEPVGHEACGDERALLVPRHQPPEDHGRVLTHDLAQGVGFVLGLRNLLHQHVLLDRAIRHDLEDACAGMGEGAHLVVVDRVGGIGAVEQLPDLLDGARFVFLEPLAQLFPRFGLAVEADPVELPGDLPDGGDDVRAEDRALFHRHRDGDERGASKGLRELVLGVDVGVVRKQVTCVGVDPNRRSRQAMAEGLEDRVQDRVEEEEAGEDQEHRHRKPVPRDESGEYLGLARPALGNVGGRAFGHRALCYLGATAATAATHGHTAR